MRVAVDSAMPSECSGKTSRPSRWSQSACVASNPAGSKPDCLSTSGSISSSSGKYGESISIASPPARSATAFVCQRALVITSASSWTAMTFSSGDPEQLRRFAEVLDLFGRLLLARLELGPVPVDPDHRDLVLDAGLDVGLVARRDVHPALLAADPPRALLEVRRVRLVRAHLLRGHDQVPIGPEMAARRAQKLVVDVGDQPDLELLGEALELGVGLAKRRPARDRIRQELGPGRLQLPAELLSALDGRAAHHLGVELVRA